MADDSLPDDDKNLFREHMRGVKPLHEKTQRVKSPHIRPSKPFIKRAKIIEPVETNYLLSDYIKDTVLSETVLSYCNPDLASMRFKNLKKGQIPWEARLDLHGLTVNAARESLSDFIHKHFEQEKRCLLIIHGKGGHQGLPPVIKNQVNRWLPQFNEVLAFHSALPKDGGLGAVYVFLKKNK